MSRVRDSFCAAASPWGDTSALQPRNDECAAGERREHSQLGRLAQLRVARKYHAHAAAGVDQHRLLAVAREAKRVAHERTLRRRRFLKAPDQERKAQEAEKSVH